MFAFFNNYLVSSTTQKIRKPNSFVENSLTAFKIMKQRVCIFDKCQWFLKESNARDSESVSQYLGSPSIPLSLDFSKFYTTLSAGFTMKPCTLHKDNMFQ